MQAAADSPAATGPFLHSGFRASALRFPDRPALLLDGRAWTYGELDGTALRWAAALTTGGAGPRRVGVLGHRSPVTYTGFLAALYAGATVVPLNRKYPAARNRDILERAEVDALLVDDRAAASLAGLLDGMKEVPRLLLPESDERPGGLADDAVVLTRTDLAGPAPLTEPVARPQESAYLLFTSGSTGRPKGVPVSHANVVAFLDANTRRYGFGPDDRFTNTFDQTFDLSVFDLFMAWGSGGCLLPMDAAELAEPLDFVREHEVTVWFSVPSVAVLQQRRGTLKPSSLPSLRWSLFCGEALAVSTAQAWQEAADKSVLENLYGPTEATIAALAHRWDTGTSPASAVNGIVPIGSPYPGTTATIRAEDGTVLPDGTTGELCLAGPQVFDGYLDAPEQTRRAFHGTAGPDGAPGRAYRTGDLARRLPDGQFVYLGRTDTQVKILGHRIETGEVEAHLLRQPGVAQAVVVAVPGDDEGTTVLAAVLSGEALDEDAVEAVDDGLRSAVPPYMIPLTYHLADVLPLNANGKVDRGALREDVVSGRLEPVLL
ncbi:amino acid adenylation domain-containing protein [Streptomyces rubiginosohelvolus]